MPEEASSSEAEEQSQGLDLSSLGGLSLGPQWGSGSIPPSKTPKSRGGPRDDRAGGRFGGGRDDRRGRPGSGPGNHRDRRAGKTVRRAEGDNAERGDAHGRGLGHGHGQGRGHGRRFERRFDEPPFEPVLKGDFYPDDNAFKALTHAIKHSCRTFELFEIARLILEKPERWVCVAKHPDQKEGEPAILHASVPDGLPFLSEQEALNHVFAHHLGEFFTVEDYEAEPPTGNFQIVHRCGMTGEIIAPPNFHRYQALLRQHHANHLAHVSFERVQARLESVREQEVIDAWLEKMKKGQRYIVKETPEGEEPTIVPDLEAARLYLLTHVKEKLVRPAYSVRFIGKDLDLMPPGHILRRSLEAMHQQQMRFPLETANNLRGRLRRLHLSVYKRGSKGVSYVCAVKRKFREPGEVLAENLSDLISFIEAHQNVRAADLPREYLGFEAEKPVATAEKPVATAEKPVDVVEKPIAESSPIAESTASEPPQRVEALDSTPDADATAPAETESSETVSTETAPTEASAEPVVEAAAEPVVEAAAEPVVEAAKPNEALVALKRDLHYLVSQGYVIEFSDGRLQVPPQKEVVKPKPKPERKKAPEAAKEPVAPVAPDAAEPAEASEAPPSVEATDAGVVPSNPPVEAPVAETSEVLEAPKPPEIAIDAPAAEAVEVTDPAPEPTAAVEPEAPAPAPLAESAPPPPEPAPAPTEPAAHAPASETPEQKAPEAVPRAIRRRRNRSSARHRPLRQSPERSSPRAKRRRIDQAEVFTGADSDVRPLFVVTAHPDPGGVIAVDVGHPS